MKWRELLPQPVFIPVFPLFVSISRLKNFEIVLVSDFFVVLNSLKRTTYLMLVSSPQWVAKNGVRYRFHRESYRGKVDVDLFNTIRHPKLNDI
jgi:hypothetical protein